MNSKKLEAKIFKAGYLFVKLETGGAATSMIIVRLNLMNSMERNTDLLSKCFKN